MQGFGDDSGVSTTWPGTRCGCREPFSGETTGVGKRARTRMTVMAFEENARANDGVVQLIGS